MKVEVLGPGCSKCDELYERARQAIATARPDAELVKVQRLDEIASHGVLFTPALVIDGEVKSTGKLPALDEIAAWLGGGG